MRGVFDGSENVVTFEGWIVDENLVEGNARADQVKDIADTDTHPANAGSAPTFAGLYSDSLEPVPIHMVLV